MSDQLQPVEPSVLRECEEALDLMGGWQEHHDLGAITEAVAPILTANLKQRIEELEGELAEAREAKDHIADRGGEVTETTTIRLRYGSVIELTDGDEEMELKVLSFGARGITTYLAPDEIHQLVEALTEEKK